MPYSATTNQHIGHRIHYARIGSRVSLSDLAEQSGIPTSQLEAFEADDDMITVVELLAIASALMLPVAYFLTNESQHDRLDQWRLVDCLQKLTPDERSGITELVQGIQDGNAISLRSRPSNQPDPKWWAFLQRPSAHSE